MAATAKLKGAKSYHQRDSVHQRNIDGERLLRHGQCPKALPLFVSFATTPSLFLLQEQMSWQDWTYIRSIMPRPQDNVDDEHDHA